MITYTHEKDNRRVLAEDEGTFVGECTYSPAPKYWIIDHTGVEKAYGGQGIALKLVTMVIELAVAAGVKVVPLCPYARKVMEKDPELGKHIYTGKHKGKEHA